MSKVCCSSARRETTNCCKARRSVPYDHAVLTCCMWRRLLLVLSDRPVKDTANQRVWEWLADRISVSILTKAEGMRRYRLARFTNEEAWVNMC